MCMNFFHLISLARIFFCTSPSPPDKFSNGPSLRWLKVSIGYPFSLSLLTVQLLSSFPVKWWIITHMAKIPNRTFWTNQRRKTITNHDFPLNSRHVLRQNQIFSALCSDWFISITGTPGSVIVPQYDSCTITVFVWGKVTIVKSVGNT